MPWNETAAVDERVKFVVRYLSSDESFSELCERFGVSRKTGYKWVERYDEGGFPSLGDRSRAPRSRPHAVSERVVKLLIDARRAHPRWGPRKLLVVVRQRHRELALPVASTVGDILRRNGLVIERRRRQRSTPSATGLSSYEGPNAVWCADFKGHFLTGARRCHPLTISDGFSRYLLRCEALKRPLAALSIPVFESAFREFGLPDVIRTDNGAPFSTLALGGLSKLAVWWLRLGIRPERIKPGRPDQNGRHERMHRTLKAETARPPRASFRAQQRAFDTFRDEYNSVRPHEALGQSTPASVYAPSPRKFPSSLDDPEYPSGFRTKRVDRHGALSFMGTQWYLGHCLCDEVVGLEELGTCCWKLYFGQLELAILDLRATRRRGSMKYALPIRTDGQPTRRPSAPGADHYPKVLPMSPV